jgi:hypothetical protein
MEYKLISEALENKRTTRTYKNISTGTICKTQFLKEGKDGMKYWGFTDLYKIPYIRIAYAKHITDMYGLGLTLKDILEWCKQEKELLNGDDPEKYQKLYALVLEKEKLANYTADPIRQHLAVATVYVMFDDERIDYFSDDEAYKKLILWGADMDLAAFFLNWHHEHIVRSIEALKKVSATVSKSVDLINKTAQSKSE